MDVKIVRLEEFFENSIGKEHLLNWKLPDGGRWWNERVWQSLIYATSIEHYARMFPDGYLFMQATGQCCRAGLVLAKKLPNPATWDDGRSNGPLVDRKVVLAMAKTVRRQRAQSEKP